MQKYKFNSDESHFIFEGYEDQSFYFNFFQNWASNSVTYISMGKKHSIELYNKLDWTVYDKRRIIIFIDRDYSRILQETVPSDINIYETTYYSIENYIVNSFILRRLINEILHFHEEEVINRILQKFEQGYHQFFKSIKPILAWILIIRSHNLKANLNQIDLSRLFSINNQLFFLDQKVNRIEYLERVTNTQTPVIGLSIFKNWYNIIDDQSSTKLVIRGKFDSWYLITFFNKLNQYLRDSEGFESKVRTNVNLANAIEIIGPRTIIPERLDSFIKRLNINL
ncbi:DUF4435 domain-containing protein [Mucilaginibacter rubeus]|nr:DUF4435 domain-containing protein [Mucilaginibacter rubeus]